MNNSFLILLEKNRGDSELGSLCFYFKSIKSGLSGSVLFNNFLNLTKISEYYFKNLYVHFLEI